MEQEAKTIVEELQEAGVMPELDKVSTAEESVSDEDETSSPLDKSVEGDDDSDSIQDGKVKLPEGTDTETAEDDESIEDFLDVDVKEDRKTSFKRGLDKLKDENALLKDELRSLKEKVDSKSSDGERVYSDTELRAAMQKAMEEGDSHLMWEIMNYKTERVKKELRGEYEGEIKAQQERAQQAKTEWATICQSYEYLADPEEDELWAGSHAELDIKNEASTLYKLAHYMYGVEPQYHRPGGSELVVAHALARIIKKRRGAKAPDKEKTRLKKQLVKERRKKSLGTGSSAEKDTDVPVRPKSEKDKLDEYLAGRRKMQQKW